MNCTELEARLDAWLDGDLPPTEYAAVEAHLATCRACAALHTDLVALRERARAAPREVTPPPAVWEAVARATRSPLHASRSRWTPWLLAAAAVLLVVLSSLGTALLLRDRGTEVASEEPLPAALSPRLAALEAEYRQAAADLIRALEEEGALTREARAALDRHLAVVDEAIAEARAVAVAGAPESGASDLLLAAYRLKLDLLERATRLGSDT